MALNLGMTSLRWQHEVPFHRNVEPGRISLHLRDDAEAGQALWSMKIDRDGSSEHMCYINDDRANLLLMELGKDIFDDFEGDWDRHSRMCKRFRIDALRAEADELERQLKESPDQQSPELA